MRDGPAEAELRRETTAWDGAEVGYYAVENEVSEGGVCYGEIAVGERFVKFRKWEEKRRTRIRVSRSEVW